MAIWLPLAQINREQITLIEEHLTIASKSFGFNSSGPKKIYFFEINTQNNLCLPLFYAQNLLGVSHYNRSRGLKCILNHNFTPQINWRYWQPTIINQAQEQLRSFGTTTLATPPGSGKTVMATYLSLQPTGQEYYPKLTLILCPRRPLIKQWAKTISNFTPFGFMVDSDAGRKFDLKLKSAAQRQPVGFLVYTPGKLKEIPDFILDSVGTLIVDEAHMACTTSAVAAILATRPEFVILCSATPYRNQDGLECMLHCLAGKHQIRIAQLKPYKVFSLKTGWLYPEKHQNRLWNGQYRPILDPVDLQKRYLSSPRYVYLVAVMLSKLAAQGRKIMVLANFKIFFELLEPILENWHLPFDRFYGKSDKFRETPILLSTVGKGGTGFDEDAYCENFSGVAINTLIIVSSIKFCGLLFQLIGRALRGENVWIFDICHNNASLKKHLTERCKLYEETSGEIHNWEIDQHILHYLEQFTI